MSKRPLDRVRVFDRRFLPEKKLGLDISVTDKLPCDKITGISIGSIGASLKINEGLFRGLDLGRGRFGSILGRLFDDISWFFNFGEILIPGGLFAGGGGMEAVLPVLFLSNGEGVSGQETLFLVKRSSYPVVEEEVIAEALEDDSKAFFIQSGPFMTRDLLAEIYASGLDYEQLSPNIKKTISLLSEIGSKIIERLGGKSFWSLDPMMDCYTMVFGNRVVADRMKIISGQFTTVDIPMVGDIILYSDRSRGIKHVAIVSKVSDGQIEKVYTRLSIGLYSYEAGPFDIPEGYGDHYRLYRIDQLKDPSGRYRRLVITNVAASGNLDLALTLSRAYFGEQ